MLAARVVASADSHKAVDCSLLVTAFANRWAMRADLLFSQFARAIAPLNKTPLLDDMIYCDASNVTVSGDRGQLRTVESLSWAG